MPTVIGQYHKVSGANVVMNGTPTPYSYKERMMLQIKNSKFKGGIYLMMTMDGKDVWRASARCHQHHVGEAISDAACAAVQADPLKWVLKKVQDRMEGIAEHQRKLKKQIADLQNESDALALALELNK